MTAKEQAEKSQQLIQAAGINSSLVSFTNGGACVQRIKVLQGRQEREAEIVFLPGKKPEGSKYLYLLPGNLDRQIEGLGIADS